MNELDPTEAADSYATLFPGVHLRLHRQDGKARELSGASVRSSCTSPRPDP